MHNLASSHVILANYILLYLDPGNGSLILQLILGALLAIGLTIRIFWSKIKGWFVHKEPNPVPTDPADPKIDDPK